MSKKKKKEYCISPGAIALPRVLKVSGVWVGVGGAVMRVAAAPGSSYHIPEATDMQYLQLARRGCPLVKLCEYDI